MFPKRAVSALTWLIMLQAGCSTPPVRPDHLADTDKSQLGRVAFVMGRYDPQFEFKTQTRSKGHGAAKAMGDGTVGSLGCGVGIFICLPLGVALGATLGAVQSASAESLANANAGLQYEIGNLGVPQKLRDALTQYVQRTGVHAVQLSVQSGPETPNSTPDYSANRGDVDTVLEVGVTGLKAETLGNKRIVIFLTLSARVRVLSATDGRVLDEFSPVQLLGARTVEEWLERGGAPVLEAVETGVKEIAESAIDESLLIYHPKKLVASSSSAILQSEVQQRSDNGASKPQQKELVPGYALRAVYPPLRRENLKLERLPGGPSGSLTIAPVLDRLPDLHPTFEWEAFPRGYDLKSGNGRGQARNLRYHFRLYRYGRFPGSDPGLGTGRTVIFEKTGLESTRYQIEQPLEPCNSYRWTVRATFELNGTPRATEWTGSYAGSSAGPVGPWESRRGTKASRASWWLGEAGVWPNVFKYPAFSTPASNGGPCPGDASWGQPEKLTSVA